MALNDKYNSLCKTDGKAHAIPDYQIRNCPLNKRVEAIVAEEGTSGSVQRIACKPA